MDEARFDELIEKIVENAMMSAVGERDELKKTIEELKGELFKGDKNKKSFTGYKDLGRLNNVDVSVSYDGYLKIEMRSKGDEVGGIFDLLALQKLLDRAFEVANV
jgi:hypothetical protein